MSYLKDLLKDAYKEGMTEEEISKALESMQVSIPVKPEIEKSKEYISLKAAFDKASGQVADYKKQLQAKMTEDEKKAAEQKEAWDNLVKENETLKREKSVADYKSQFLAMGYDDTLAQSTAEALTDGNIATVMKNQSEFAASMEKKIRADIMRGTPDPVGGKSSSTMTLADLRKMSMQDRFKFSQEHPEEYAQLYSSENNNKEE